MTIEKVKEEKKILENKINAAWREFERINGVKISMFYDTDDNDGNDAEITIYL